MSLEHVDDRDNGRYLKLFGFGVVLWLVPFLVSFLFYSPQGTPLVGVAFFNSIMSVALIVVASVLLFLYFKQQTTDYMREAVKVGVVWILVSVVLDLVVLVPMAKMTIGQYITDVALGYIVILVIALLAGMLLEEKATHSKRIFSQVASTKK